MSSKKPMRDPISEEGVLEGLPAGCIQEVSERRIERAIADVPEAGSIKEVPLGRLLLGSGLVILLLLAVLLVLGAVGLTLGLLFKQLPELPAKASLEEIQQYNSILKSWADMFLDFVSKSVVPPLAAVAAFALGVAGFRRH